MKIAVFTDLRFVRSETPTGVGKHIVQMLGGLAGTAGNEVTVLAARDQFMGPELRLPSGTLPLPVRRLRLPWKAAEALWTLAGGPAVDGSLEGVDWVYCPKNDFIPVRRTRLAVTIHGAHDLDPQMPKTPGLRARLNRVRWRLSYARVTARADLILTVSDFLKARIVEWFGCDEKRVAVVGNGVEQVYFEAANLPAGCLQHPLGRPFLLCVGGLNDLDGGGLLLDVAERLARSAPELRIVVAGWQHEPRLLAHAGRLPNVELPGYVPADRLALLMRDAVALLYLPNYETFGIAAAEAMAAGTPIITTGSTAVPEIVGDAGLYTLPDPDDVMDKIGQILQDTGLADSLRRAGRERARIFTWQACVDRLNSALASNSR